MQFDGAYQSFNSVTSCVNDKWFEIVPEIGLWFSAETTKVAYNSRINNQNTFAKI